MHLTGTPKLTYELTGEDISQAIVEIRRQLREELQLALKLQSERPLTVKDAAQFLSIHQDTLLDRVKAGLPHHRDGKTFYFYPSELNAYIKSKKR
jgi:excisionase family DNA binding protein